jgi:hypothetical protein
MIGRLRAWWSVRRSSEAALPAIRADRGSVAAAGDIRDSTIRIGLDEQEMSRLFEEKFAVVADQVAREKGVPALALRVVLTKLGETDIKDEDIPERLHKAANELIELRERLTQLNDRPELAAIRKQAAALVDQGELDLARITLDRGRDVARKLREDASINEFALIVDSARIDSLQLDHTSAAAKYAEAATIMAPVCKLVERCGLRMMASELVSAGGHDRLVQATAIYKDLLARTSPTDEPKNAMKMAHEERMPFELALSEWISTQHQLGIALLAMSQADGETNVAQAREAAMAFLRAATWSEPGDQRGLNQYLIADTLMKISRVAPDARYLEQAIVNYNEALKGLDNKREVLRAICEHNTKHANYLLEQIRD